MLTKEMIDNLGQCEYNLGRLSRSMELSDSPQYDRLYDSTADKRDLLYAAVLTELESMQSLIERMKCCGNCRYCEHSATYEGLICIHDNSDADTTHRGFCPSWEMYDAKTG